MDDDANLKGNFVTTLEITQLFFKYQRDHRVNTMLELFSVNGISDYVPIGAAGPATDVGRTLWEGLIDAFPDLTNEIKAGLSMTGSEAVVDGGHSCSGL